jgi:hypothetical protein
MTVGSVSRGIGSNAALRITGRLLTCFFRKSYPEVAVVRSSQHGNSWHPAKTSDGAF